jgi:hypothetical protein
MAVCTGSYQLGFSYTAQIMNYIKYAIDEYGTAIFVQEYSVFSPWNGLPPHNEEYGYIETLPPLGFNEFYLLIRENYYEGGIDVIEIDCDPDPCPDPGQEEPIDWDDDGPIYGWDENNEPIREPIPAEKMGPDCNLYIEGNLP